MAGAQQFIRAIEFCHQNNVAHRWVRNLATLSKLCIAQHLYKATCVTASCVSCLIMMTSPTLGLQNLQQHAELEPLVSRCIDSYFCLKSSTVHLLTWTWQGPEAG